MARIGPSANLCRHMLYRAVALAAGFGGDELTAWGLRGDAIRARLQAVRGRLRRKVHSAQPLTEAEEEMQARLTHTRTHTRTHARARARTGPCTLHAVPAPVA